MKFTIDYETWRCGSDGPNKHGEGSTMLLNGDGYMCCLGQIELQLGATEEIVARNYSPAEVGLDNILVERNYQGSRVCSAVAFGAMEINDDPGTTPTEKMELLKALFAEHGHEIEFVNVPGVV